jgi:hypothetical protein
MAAIFEGRFFDVCLDRERKDIMIKAIDIYIDRLEEGQASRSLTQRVRWLKEEIENMKTC